MFRTFRNGFSHRPLRNQEHYAKDFEKKNPLKKVGQGISPAAPILPPDPSPPTTSTTSTPPTLPPLPPPRTVGLATSLRLRHSMQGTSCRQMTNDTADLATSLRLRKLSNTSQFQNVRRWIQPPAFRMKNTGGNLPWGSGKTTMQGNSRDLATSRLKKLRKVFRRQPPLKKNMHF